jgi:hypothetical protein
MQTPLHQTVAQTLKVAALLPALVADQHRRPVQVEVTEALEVGHQQQLTEPLKVAVHLDQFLEEETLSMNLLPQAIMLDTKSLVGTLSKSILQAFR